MVPALERLIAPRLTALARITLFSFMFLFGRWLLVELCGLIIRPICSPIGCGTKGRVSPAPPAQMAGGCGRGGYGRCPVRRGGKGAGGCGSRAFAEHAEQAGGADAD